MASHDGDSQSRPVDLPVSFKTNACVKKVVDFKYYNGQRLYKVKWESTWEPEENLLEYQNLLDQFWGFIKRVQLEDNCGPVHKKARLENSHDGRQLKDALETPTCKSHSLTPKINCLPTFKIDSENSLGSQIHSNNAEGQIEVPKEETIICTTINPVADINFTRDVNDLTLYWDNPYVRIGFFCRLCNDEQPFSHDEKKWRQHFLTHIRLRPQEKCLEMDSSITLTDADQRMFNNPEKPWIQKVEHLIQKWGVNQYVRLAFLCCICEKEQQAQHTGNWRNHYMSHESNRSHMCEKCNKPFKSRNDLKRHRQLVHEDSKEDSRHIRVHTCRICFMQFKKKFEMKQHIAKVHSIDPENLVHSQEKTQNNDFQSVAIEAGKTKSMAVRNVTKQHTQGFQETAFSSSLPVDSSNLSTSNHPDNCLKPVENYAQVISTVQRKVLNTKIISHSSHTKVNLSQIKHMPSIKDQVMREEAPARDTNTSIAATTNVCTACLSSFPTKIELLAHRKNSSNPLCQGDGDLRVHICKLCSKRFKRRYDLNRHTTNAHNMEFDIAKFVSYDNNEVPPLNEKQDATMCNLMNNEEQACQTKEEEKLPFVDVIIKLEPIDENESYELQISEN